jgi:hypothetical protein
MEDDKKRVRMTERERQRERDRERERERLRMKGRLWSMEHGVCLFHFNKILMDKR